MSEKLLNYKLTEAKAELVKGEQSQSAIVNQEAKVNITNTITVDETKEVVKFSKEELKKYINDALTSIREGQYVKVDTTTYPTLEEFLASTGEQGTVYLYPLDENGNYEQYIWEVNAWIDLGSTKLDISNMVTTDTDQTITGVKTFDSNAFKVVLSSKPTQPLIFDFDSNQSNNEARIMYLNTRMITMSEARVRLNKHTLPYANNLFDLGDTYFKWKDLYLAGKITDGTYVKSLAQLVESEFNVINATDIVDNTLTDAQYALITNGRPTLIKGSLLSRTDIFLVSMGGGSSSKFFIGYSGTNEEAYQLVVSSKVISRVGSATGIKYLQSIAQFNGKDVPDYPSSTGSFTLKCVDGTLTWVAD